VVRYLDRRYILLIGSAACGLSQLAPAIAWSIAPNTVPTGDALVAFICLFTFFYTATAPYAWLAGGEMPSLLLRSATYGIGTAANFLGNWAGTFSAPYFINPASSPGFGATYGYIWAGSNAIVFIFVLFFLPETKDRTLEEIDEMFEAKVPSRKFKSYKSIQVQAIAEAVDEKQAVEVQTVENTAA